MDNKDRITALVYAKYEHTKPSQAMLDTLLDFEIDLENFTKGHPTKIDPIKLQTIKPLFDALQNRDPEISKFAKLGIQLMDPYHYFEYSED